MEVQTGPQMTTVYWKEQILGASVQEVVRSLKLFAAIAKLDDPKLILTGRKEMLEIDLNRTAVAVTKDILDKKPVQILMELTCFAKPAGKRNATAPVLNMECSTWEMHCAVKNEQADKVLPILNRQLALLPTKTERKTQQQTYEHRKQDRLLPMR